MQVYVHSVRGWERLCAPAWHRSLWGACTGPWHASGESGSTLGCFHNCSKSRAVASAGPLKTSQFSFLIQRPVCLGNDLSATGLSGLVGLGTLWGCSHFALLPQVSRGCHRAARLVFRWLSPFQRRESEFCCKSREIHVCEHCSASKN